MDKEATVERVGGYRVVRRLATGGTSDVLLARAEGPHGFERTVVLKLLLSQFRNDEEVARMFAREAAAYARLSHPSIVRLFDFFALDGQLVMVLEFVDGPPLNRLRGMLKAVGQPLDDKGAFYVAQRIFAALASAHAATDSVSGAPTPVIHRDVNPSNVLVPWDGHVKLADFGIAKVTGVSHQSQAGLIKGTYGYMAPEQVTGEEITPRADVYAGGIILWEMLTKRRAFQRGALPEIEVLRQMSEPKITSLDVLRPDVDRTVRDAMRRALEAKAERRDITAEEMATILRDVVPSEDGREHLTKALAAVRHEPKPAPSIIPGMVDETPAPRIPAPAPVPVPRPRGATIGFDSPKAPPAKPTPPPGTVKGVQAPTPKPSTATARGLPPPVPTPRKPTPAPMAATLPLATVPSDARPTAPPGEIPLSLPPSTTPSLAPREVKIFDDYVEPPEVVAQRRISERIRAAASPIEELAGGKPLREAIDDILQNVPSSIPPQMFPDTTPPKGAVLPAHILGKFPAPPPPFEARPGPTTPANGAPPEAFAALDRTVAMDSRPVPPNPDFVPTVRPAPVAAKTSTDRMPGVGMMPLTPTPSGLSTQAPALSAAIAQTLMSADARAAVGDAGAQPIVDAVAPRAPTTEPFLQASTTAPLVMPAPGSTPPGGPPGPWPQQAPPASSSPPMFGAPPGSTPPLLARQPSGASFQSESVVATVTGEHPRPRRTGTAVLAVVVIMVVVGIGGTFGVLQWRKGRAVTVTPTVVAPPPATTPSASVSTVASTPAVASSAPPAVSAAPSASASSVASASPSASASASSAAVVASAPGSSEIPAGMGLLRSDTAPAGHRIYVDDRVVGETPTPVTVKCGAHTVKVGSSGYKRPVDVPCGGELTLER